ncbi:kinase-like domain-containing protein [Amanita rubescens]|nr:kinase-like domain-containing protein [Amanita rubescens]
MGVGIGTGLACRTQTHVAGTGFNEGPQSVDPHPYPQWVRLLQVAQGLDYIHSEGITHGCIRGANILLDDNLQVQIVDFGLTRLSAATGTRSGAFHICFAAPELFGISEDDPDSFSDAPLRTQISDVYAFGCLYYEIHYGTVPFARKSAVQIWKLVTRCVLPPRLDEPPLSDGVWDIIQRCWTRETSKRPKMRDVMNLLHLSLMIRPHIALTAEQLMCLIVPAYMPLQPPLLLRPVLYYKYFT